MCGLTSNAVLSGFTLVNGSTRDNVGTDQETSGGGVWCESMNAVITNCTLKDNLSSRFGGGAYGGTRTIAHLRATGLQVMAVGFTVER